MMKFACSNPKAPKSHQPRSLESQKEITARKNPIEALPTSPRNILAFGKLCGKNPIPPPARIRERVTAGCFNEPPARTPTIAVPTPVVATCMQAMPLIPSMKLKEFVYPSIQKNPRRTIPADSKGGRFHDRLWQSA
jgi:hypothetical protein